jgi:hypothetical protein
MDRSKPPRRGRPPIANRALTSTERNKRRIERLAAREIAEGAMRGGLEKLHGELTAAGVPDQASDLARILRTTALKAVAEYTRRMSIFSSKPDQVLSVWRKNLLMKHRSMI